MLKALSIKYIDLTDICIYISLCLLIFLWLSVAFLELNIYSKFTIFSLSITLIAALFLPTLGIFIKRIKINYYKMDFIAIGFIFLFCVLNIVFFHEGFSGGRDDGVYANMAVHISKNNSLNITNPLVASYPGFIQTSSQITSQFYPGYPTWISIFFILFGYENIRFVNFPLIFFGLYLVYSLGKLFFSRILSLVSILIISTSFPFFWFTRETFTENIFFFIAWFVSLCVIKGFQTKDLKYFVFSYIAIGVLTTIRVEALAFLIMLNIIVLFGVARQKVYIPANKLLLGSSLVLIIFLPAIYYYLFIDPRYLGEILNTLTTLVSSITNRFSHSENDQTDSIKLSKSIIQYHQPELTYFLLQLYNLFFYIIFIPLAFIKSITYSSAKNRYYFMILIILLLPNLFYLYNPSINLDQPWFLRRYMSVIIPLSVLSLIYLLTYINNSLRMIILSTLLTVNLIISSHIIAITEYSGTLSIIKNNFANFFKPTDLVLVDYSNTGHYKIAEPMHFLYGVNTASIQESSLNNLLGEKATKSASLYTTGAFVLPQKSVCKYTSIYLITSKKENFIKEKLENNSISIKEFGISYNELEKTCELFRLSSDTSLEAMAHIDLGEAKSYCDAIPGNIFNYSQKMELLKLDKSFVDKIHSISCR